jgi:hypothetical protein
MLLNQKDTFNIGSQFAVKYSDIENARTHSSEILSSDDRIKQSYFSCSLQIFQQILNFLKIELTDPQMAELQRILNEDPNNIELMPEQIIRLREILLYLHMQIATQIELTNDDTSLNRRDKIFKISMLQKDQMDITILIASLETNIDSPNELTEQEKQKLIQQLLQTEDPTIYPPEGIKIEDKFELIRILNKNPDQILIYAMSHLYNSLSSTKKLSKYYNLSNEYNPILIENDTQFKNALEDKKLYLATLNLTFNRDVGFTDTGFWTQSADKMSTKHSIVFLIYKIEKESKIYIINICYQKFIEFNLAITSEHIVEGIVNELYERYEASYYHDYRLVDSNIKLFDYPSKKNTTRCAAYIY